MSEGHALAHVQEEPMGHEENGNGSSRWLMGIVAVVLGGLILSVIGGYQSLSTSQATLSAQVEQLREDVRSLKADARTDRDNLRASIEQLRLELASRR